MRYVFAFLGFAGFFLVFGGVGVIDEATDNFTMFFGFFMSLIGLLAMAVFVMSAVNVVEDDHDH